MNFKWFVFLFVGLDLLVNIFPVGSLQSVDDGGGDKALLLKYFSVKLVKAVRKRYFTNFQIIWPHFLKFLFLAVVLFHERLVLGDHRTQDTPLRHLVKHCGVAVEVLPRVQLALLPIIFKDNKNYSLIVLYFWYFIF